MEPPAQVQSKILDIPVCFCTSPWPKSGKDVSCIVTCRNDIGGIDDVCRTYLGIQISSR